MASVYNVYIVPSLKIDRSLFSSNEKYECLYNLFKYCLGQINLPTAQLDLDIVCQALCSREQLGSTAWGGYALPHTKLPTKKGLILSIRLKEPISWPTGSMDGRPTSIIIIVVTPENSTGAHLKLMATIDRSLKRMFKEHVGKIKEVIFKKVFIENLNELNEISSIKIVYPN